MWPKNNSVRNTLTGSSPKNKDSPHDVGPPPKMDSNYKSMYDSQSDSGFLSGSNLISESEMRVSNISTESSHDFGSPSQSSTDFGHSKDDYTTSSTLDSGIVDLPEQLRSLNITSTSDVCTISSNNSSKSNNNNNNIPSEQINSSDQQSHNIPQSLPTPKLGLSREHIIILKNIFAKDECGDT